jgi:putative flippase GtrA
LRATVTKFVDWFYPPFRRVMPLLTFRYAVCGAVNTLLGLLVYYLSYHFLFDQVNVDLGIVVFKAHMAALFVSGSFSFCFGFIINKFVVFVESNLRGRVQLFRYFLSFSFNLTLNYFMLKLLVENFRWDAFLSQLITTFFVIMASFITQKYFTFKVS